MDVSDGLVGDLTKMMRVSGASAHVDVAHSALSTAAAAMIGAIRRCSMRALTGGDDYGISPACRSRTPVAFEAAAETASVAVTRIGRHGRGKGDAPPSPRRARRAGRCASSGAPGAILIAAAGTPASLAAHISEPGAMGSRGRQHGEADRAAKRLALRLAAAGRAGQVRAGTPRSVYATASIIRRPAFPSHGPRDLPLTAFVVGMACGTLPVGAIARRYGGGRRC